MRVVFFGDSLTEGADGASYLRLLQQSVEDDVRTRGIELVNAGLGGDTVVNLARRAERDVISVAPDWVVIFIGINDCVTWYTRRAVPTPPRLASRRYFRVAKGVRGAVTPARYRHGLRALVDRLRAETSAGIALCTPAAFGESPCGRRARLLEHYARTVREVAAERDCTLIDVRAAFVRAMAARNQPSPWTRLARLPISLLARLECPSGDFDYEGLARRRGYLWTYDGVHLTRLGATLVAGIMHNWLLDTLSAMASSRNASTSENSQP